MLEAGIVGLPAAGKTTLFNVLTRAGVGPDFGKEHVGMAPIADDRLGQLAEVVSAAKVTPAAARVTDVPGTGPQLLGNLRRVDALLEVADGFSRGADPESDFERLELELLVADRDHVERRLERVRTQAKSGDAALWKEVSSLERVLAHVQAGGSLSDCGDDLPAGLSADLLDHARGAGQVLELATKRQPVAVRQLEVDDRYVRPPLPCERQCLLGTACAADRLEVRLTRKERLHA